MRRSSNFRRIVRLGVALSMVFTGSLNAAQKLNKVQTSVSGQGSSTQSAALQRSALAATSVLDTTLIRKYYLDGDFDQAIENLEAGLKEKRPYTHEDSVFIFKHLGVMYAAKYDTREKGKYYMHQLLTVEPTARILDMYASDMIYMIFKNIQDEFDQASGRLSRAEGHVAGNAQANQKNISTAKPIKSADSKNSSNSSKGKALYWVGGSTVAVAAGVTAYFLLADKGSSESSENHGIE